jgi:hypothetical protein
MRNTPGSKWIVAALLVAGMAAAGCATTSKDFKLSNVGPGEAAIAGRLTIVYNGQVYTENCKANFGGNVLTMARDGIVLFVVPAGSSRLQELLCKDVSMQHVAINDVHFVARPGVVNDLGDIVVTWDAVGGLKISSMFGLIGALIDAASDDGVATSVVRPPVAEVREAFKLQTGVAGVWSVPLVPVIARPASPPPARAVVPTDRASPAAAAAPTAATDPAPDAATCAGAQPDTAGSCGELLR